MENNFFGKNITCCSVELHWTNEDIQNGVENPYEYELYQTEGSGLLTTFNSSKVIFKGKSNSYEAINLKPNEKYTFKLKIFKDKNFIEERKKVINTLKAPYAVLSDRSLKIANGEAINYTNILSDYQKKIIANCSSYIYKKKNEDLIKGNFEGIKIKITQDITTSIYYISFDIKPEYFEAFFKQFIEESQNNLIIPCHFIIQKLPTTLIFNLLEKGPVIFTGKRMGGVIASSLAFYILYIGKMLYNKNYGNSFKEREKNCIGVVTFGSPTFLNNMTVAMKMKDFTDYFYHIKEEFDYIPQIIGFMKKGCDKENWYGIIQGKKMDFRDIESLKEYLIKNEFTEENMKKNIEKHSNIPFGHYYMMKERDSSLNSINELTFNEFYYFKSFHSLKEPSDLRIYENLGIQVSFSKQNLTYLENKNYILEFIKITRRKINENSMKGIIKFKLDKFEDNIITPDIIEEIKLISNTDESKHINIENIYYDSDVDIIAYINELNENIKDVIIINNFGGEIRFKHIINIQGSGETRELIGDNIEKLFLIPFFKLFEIFYNSLNNRDKYNELKKQHFGENFQDLTLLTPFQTQIKTFNELLQFSRPDILGKFEKQFMNEYIGGGLTEEQKKEIKVKLKDYYEQAIEIQKAQNINCLDSESGTIAKINSFPQIIDNSKEIKKLFMCPRSCFENENILTLNYEDIYDSYIKKYYIQKSIEQVLKGVEHEIYQNKSNLNDEEFKNDLNKRIGILYNKFIIPNIFFVKILVLSSIESGDLIYFKRKMSWEKIKKAILDGNLSNLKYYLNLLTSSFFFHKDFEKFYSKNKIENIHMDNLFSKTKNKNIVKSNIASSSLGRKDIFFESYGIFFTNLDKIIKILFKVNKIGNFVEYSEKQKIGVEYYKTFLQLLNNYSNDFPEDIEISIYENLKEENKNSKNSFQTIKEMMNDLVSDEESKKGFLALLRQSYLLGKLRTNVEDEFIIGVFGKKKSGKSTFINKIFKECETNNSYANSTIGLNLYTIKGTENFAIMDSPGDTEIDENLELFASKGYLFSKMFVYLISEESQLDSDSLRKNKKLEHIIKLRTKYKIPLIILLTHFDNYCDKVKKEKDWKIICREHFRTNKKTLLDYINKIIGEEKGNNYKMEEDKIMHIILVEPNNITDEESLQKLYKNPKLKKKYDKANPEDKKKLLEFFKTGIESTENEIRDFFEKEEMEIFSSKELIEKIKESLPCQYHRALNQTSNENK